MRARERSRQPRRIDDPAIGARDHRTTRSRWYRRRSCLPSCWALSHRAASSTKKRSDGARSAQFGALQTRQVLGFHVLHRGRSNASMIEGGGLGMADDNLRRRAWLSMEIEARRSQAVRGRSKSSVALLRGPAAGLGVQAEPLPKVAEKGTEATGPLANLHPDPSFPILNKI